MCCVSDLGVEVSPVGVERIQGHGDKSRDNGLKASNGAMKVETGVPVEDEVMKDDEGSFSLERVVIRELRNMRRITECGEEEPKEIDKEFEEIIDNFEVCSMERSRSESRIRYWHLADDESEEEDCKEKGMLGEGEMKELGIVERSERLMKMEAEGRARELMRMMLNRMEELRLSRGSYVEYKELKARVEQMIAIWGSEDDGGELKDEGNERGNEASNEVREEEVSKEKAEVDIEVDKGELMDGDEAPSSQRDVEEEEDKKVWG